jgi:hypothetical protein
MRKITQIYVAFSEKLNFKQKTPTILVLGNGRSSKRSKEESSLKVYFFSKIY